MVDEDRARNAGAFLREQAIRDAKSLGPGSIERANARKREDWGMSLGGEANELAAFVLALGLDPIQWSARAARFSEGPIAEFLSLGRQVKQNRREKRLPKALSAARARSWRRSELPEIPNVEWLEGLRFDRPRKALKETYKALGKAEGPVAVGRVLCVHACTLRECDDLAGALLSLYVAIPILDVVDDSWGLGRALASASAVSRACGDFELSRGLIGEAESWYVRAESASGRALAMAVRGGLILATGGDARSALRELEASLALLPSTEERRVAIINQVRALALLELGLPLEARRAIQAAEANCPDAEMMRGKIAWHAGDIESACGRHSEAAALYRRAYRLISDPICDRLLVAAQALRSMIRAGEMTRAANVAESLLGPLFDRLDDSNLGPNQSLLEASYRDLFRAATEARLAGPIVDRAVSALNRAREVRRKTLASQIVA